MPINGIEQWVTIKGDSCANPVILIAHGGPGNPISAHSDRLYASWRSAFTIVNWDRRGAGMSYGRNPPAETDQLTVAQLRDDGIAVARYATRHLGDQETIAKLETLGPPPWRDPRNFGILRRFTRKYEAARTEPNPKAWWEPAARYTTPKAQADCDAGEDQSDLRFVGLKGDGMRSGVDLPALGQRRRCLAYSRKAPRSLFASG